METENLFDQLLDATIQHLECLKTSGRRFVDVSPEVLQDLSAPARPRTSAAMRQVQRPAAPLPPARKATSSAQPAPAPASAPDAVPATITKTAIPVPAATRDAAASSGSASAPLDKAAKAKAFEELRQRVLACTKCERLVAARKNVVFGVGNLDADLMFVGEAPGAEEDLAGEPFVGKAGQLLTKIIQTMGLSREQVYIANILKCRPDTPGQATGNRKPTPEEMATCIPFLQEQIDIIRPKVMVALGVTAVEGLLGKEAITRGIIRMRGQWKTYRAIPLMLTYHPAYLLRNQSLQEKRRVWEDMLAVMEKLGMTISERQRNYFL